MAVLLEEPFGYVDHEERQIGRIGGGGRPGMHKICAAASVLERRTCATWSGNERRCLVLISDKVKNAK